MNRKAIIFGIKGFKISTEERYLLKNAKPWGIILFSRNVENLFQLKSLVSDIKNIFKDKKYPILIDQEGGEVSRLNKILDFMVCKTLANILQTIHQTTNNIIIF